MSIVSQSIRAGEKALGGGNWSMGPIQILSALASRYRKALGLLACDAVLTLVSAYVTLCLDASVFPLPAHLGKVLPAFFGPLLLVRLGSLAIFGAYRTIVRHTGVRDIIHIAIATCVSSAVFALFSVTHRQVPYGISGILIGWYTHLFLIAGSRFTYSMLWRTWKARQRQSSASTRQRILILGAGVRGASLARELKLRSAGTARLVGFLDDDKSKQGHRIDGVPVLGKLDDLRRVVEEQEVDLVVVAIGATTGKRLRHAMRQCEGLDIRFQVAASLDLARSDRPLETLRNICLEDLLHRDAITTDMARIGEYLTGERVLVTGAGGSIGSELVRQIAASRPAEMILLGHGENSLFEIQQELLRTLDYATTCIVADIRDYDRLLQLFMRHRPTIVFHAAAHKHVGLMQSNPEEAVTNNVLGTRNLARIATKTGVKRFVMISTDKAVNPTSVMGMTKRVAEKVVQAESRRSKTQFAGVRFGNVLGSRGSVVPLMRKQIENGGPVTVTHPDIVRYFMTIPEAAQLVITAGAFGENGAIYLLEMGDPVRILDLANDLIRLAGLTPGKDISIEITGLKPGEKLYEELLTAEEGAKVTKHERIFMAAPTEFAADTLSRYVDALIEAARRGDSAEVIKRLRKVDAMDELMDEPLDDHIKSQINSLDARLAQQGSPARSASTLHSAA